MVQVEFYGIPRQRAGIASIVIEATNVGELLDNLSNELPKFAQACLTDRSLNPEFLLSVNGRHFTRDVTEVLAANDRILILSADVGG